MSTSRERKSTKIINESRRLRSLDLESSIQRENSKTRRIDSNSRDIEYLPNYKQALPKETTEKSNISKKNRKIVESQAEYLEQRRANSKLERARKTRKQHKEISKILNHTLDGNNKSKYAKDYIQRKVDHRIQEIKQLSSEKRKNRIEDTHIIVQNNSKKDGFDESKNYYHVFHMNPDRDTSPGKPKFMKNHEFGKLKQDENFPKKSDNLTRTLFHDNLCNKNRGDANIAEEHDANDEQKGSDLRVKHENSNTLETRTCSGLTSTEDLFQKVATYDKNAIQDEKSEFQEAKDRAIMEGKNRITQLENIVNDLRIQIKYLNDHDCNEDLIEKITQYQKLIELQIVDTLNLSSFKYLQKCINEMISLNRESSNGLQIRTSIDSLEIKEDKNFLSPKNSGYYEKSQPVKTYVKKVNQAKNSFPLAESKIMSTLPKDLKKKKQLEPVKELESHDLFVPLTVRNSNKNSQAFKKQVDKHRASKKLGGKKTSCPGKTLQKTIHEKSSSLYQELKDMKNTTSGLLSTKNHTKKRIKQHMLKHKRHSVATDYDSEINKRLDQAIGMASQTKSSFKQKTSKITNLRNALLQSKPVCLTQENPSSSHEPSDIRPQTQKNAYPARSYFWENTCLNSPSKLADTFETVEADLYYDSEKCELSFSTEKIQKQRSKRDMPLVLPSKILKY
ncbi:unnamed protein product [Moneuplotes crassus]|uniref:Uncharacterized protein n=1 Tax=Euplotes crassus TaxID=5936 RepID=A0AAD1YBJ6_EUPCR|nr:unnamed protein product [Moneuplotes crassus]